MKKNTDIVIAGGGLAGLSLAIRLSGSVFPFSSLTIIDSEPKKSNDRTWCFWSVDEGEPREILAHEWDRIGFRHEKWSREIPLGEYRYRMIRGLDFYRHADRILAADSRIRRLAGKVESMHTDESGVRVQVALPDGNQAELHGDWVFDGRFSPRDFRVDEKRYHFLKQHFMGWTIQADHDVFDPGLPVMFDFRDAGEPDDPFSFMYVLPEDTRKALVEFTFFSRDLLNDQAYVDGLEKWISRQLGLQPGTYRILDTEKGIIPMTDQPFGPRVDGRIMKIGTNAGMVKACTGFAFHRIQEDSRKIVESLIKTGRPDEFAPVPGRYRTFDAMLLDILAKRPGMARKVFLGLFRKNPIGRIFRFLDEEAGMAETIALMASVPWWPFIRAWMVIKLRHAGFSGKSA